MSSADAFWPESPLSYGITPPKVTFSPERRARTAATQTERIRALPIDALVVYDLQDESSRTDAKRPFPYLEAIEPLEYATQDLHGVAQPKVVYRSVSNMTPDTLVDWLGRVRSARSAAVLVGAPSRDQPVRLGLGEAYRTRMREANDVPLGGVAIAERHEASGVEHERMLKKGTQGCSFFISQTVYSQSASQSLMSDLYYRCEALEQPVPTFIVSLSPCGSLKTLEFLHWLGVTVPRWMENELRHANDILSTSIDLSVDTFAALLDFARSKAIPLGCNVESVSLNKAEIDASVELLHRIARLLGRD